MPRGAPGTRERVRSYIGLGANLGQPMRQLRTALRALARLPGCDLVCCSAFYRSTPLDGTAQPDFVNAVAALDTTLPPEALLVRLQDIEARLGRIRTGRRWGPRTLDLDLLLYGDLRIDRDGLQVPHPGLLQRDFVLYPLAEIAPQLQIPGVGSLSASLERCPARGLQRLESSSEQTAS